MSISLQPGLVEMLGREDCLLTPLFKTSWAVTASRHSPANGFPLTAPFLFSPGCPHPVLVKAKFGSLCFSASAPPPHWWSVSLQNQNYLPRRLLRFWEAQRLAKVIQVSELGFKRRLLLLSNLCFLQTPSHHINLMDQCLQRHQAEQENDMLRTSWEGVLFLLCHVHEGDRRQCM